MNQAEKEIWKTIPQLPNYAVSNHGRVKRIEHVTVIKERSGRIRTMRYKEQLVKLAKNKGGYLTFRPSTNEGLKQMLVHRFVALAFIPNPNNLPLVNHKDENRKNNHVSNLEWITNVDNINYKDTQKRHSESLRKTLRDKVCLVKQYSKDGKLIAEYKGKKELVDAGFNYYAVVRCCKHLSKSACGFVWRRDDDPFRYKADVRNDDCCKKTVQCFDLTMNLVAEYNGTKEAARAIEKPDTASANISRCCLGHRPTAFSFIWKYKE